MTGLGHYAPEQALLRGESSWMNPPRCEVSGTTPPSRLCCTCGPRGPRQLVRRLGHYAPEQALLRLHPKLVVFLTSRSRALRPRAGSATAVACNNHTRPSSSRVLRPRAGSATMRSLRTTAEHVCLGFYAPEQALRLSTVPAMRGDRVGLGFYAPEQALRRHVMTRTRKREVWSRVLRPRAGSATRASPCMAGRSITVSGSTPPSRLCDGWLSKTSDLRRFRRALRAVLAGDLLFYSGRRCDAMLLVPFR